MNSEVDFLVNLNPHPNIAQIDFLKKISNYIYIFLEYIEGRSLYEIIPGPSIDFEKTINYAYQIAKGLHYLHNTARLLHLDVKPTTIAQSHAYCAPPRL